jgi:hypothetical protein
MCACYACRLAASFVSRLSVECAWMMINMSAPSLCTLLHTAVRYLCDNVPCGVVFMLATAHQHCIRNAP